MLLALGVLGILSVSAIAYVTIVRLDRESSVVTIRQGNYQQQADVVVYDRLVAKPILDMTRRDARRIYVGKERNNHAMRQEEINRLLADAGTQLDERDIVRHKLVRMIVKAYEKEENGKQVNDNASV
jgi:siroheme synthase